MNEFKKGYSVVREVAKIVAFRHSGIVFGLLLIVVITIMTVSYIILTLKMRG